jgi:hypothetical protein
MRKEKELLQLMLEHKNKFGKGLCQWILEMYSMSIFSTEEYQKMDRYICFYRPQRIIEHDIDVYSWDPGLIEPRIAWIKEQIKRLEQIEEDNKNGYQTWVID